MSTKRFSFFAALIFCLALAQPVFATSELTMNYRYQRGAAGYTFLKNGKVGRSYSDYLKASGGKAPYTWEISDGSLPPGLYLSPVGSKKIRIIGKPTRGGTYDFILKVTDKNGDVDATALSITIQTTKLTIKKRSFTIGAEGVSYSGYATASGGTDPYTWKITNGSLPEGLSFNPSGSEVYVTGTPAEVGNFRFTLELTDDEGSSFSKAVSIKIGKDPANKLRIKYTFDDGTVDEPYSSLVVGGGGASPYTWAITEGSLPEGLSLVPSELDKECTISGTPRKEGTYNFKIKMTDRNGLSKEVARSIKINSVLSIAGEFEKGALSRSYESGVRVEGGTAPYKWEITNGSLPEGLSLNSSSNFAYVEGTPTETGTFKFTLRVTDKNGYTKTRDLFITIPDGNIKIYGYLKNGLLGGYYIGSIEVAGGTVPYTWKMLSGSLPKGLRLNIDPYDFLVSLRGTPTETGTFNFTLKVTDSFGYYASKDFSITIPVNDLEITGNFDASAFKGFVYPNQWLEAKGGKAPYKWKIISGSLPKGLSFKTSKEYAYLVGAPEETGTFSFTVELRDNIGYTAEKSITLSVLDPADFLESAAQNNHGTPNYAGAFNTAGLHVASDDIIEIGTGRDEDLVKVKANMPLTFKIGERVNSDGEAIEAADVTVYVNGEPQDGIEIFDGGTFTLPADMVHDDFVVSVLAKFGALYLQSEELFINAEE